LLKRVALVPGVLWLVLGFVLLTEATDQYRESSVSLGFVYWSAFDAALLVSAVVLFVGGYVLTAMADSVPAEELGRDL
jgi:uncharacterized integral membrane protein